MNFVHPYVDKINMNEIDNIMKRKNFVKDTDGWIRKWTFITVDNRQWKIGHSIEKKVGKMSNIEFKDIDMWCNYFDRI